VATAQSILYIIYHICYILYYILVYWYIGIVHTAVCFVLCLRATTAGEWGHAVQSIAAEIHISCTAFCCLIITGVLLLMVCTVLISAAAC
jgi:hypothetical protein